MPIISTSTDNTLRRKSLLSLDKEKQCLLERLKDKENCFGNQRRSYVHIHINLIGSNGMIYIKNNTGCG